MKSHYAPSSYKQLPLLGMELYNEHSTFADPAFSGNKSLPIHRWVPWIAGFSSGFVASALDEYLNNSGIILDPFAGVGTTLIEAVLHGHDAVGFEINPYAALACELKANAHQANVKVLEEESLRFWSFYQTARATDYAPHSSYPKGFKTRSVFYSPKVLHKVLVIRDFIETVQNTQIRDFFRLAFASTMVRYSNYSYEPSLGRRTGAGKEDIKDFPVGETVLAKLEEMKEDIAWFRNTIPDNANPNARIICDSFFHSSDYLAPESIDLIVTSPPYLNNYHYIRNTRPQLYWLDYAQHPNDLKSLEQSNFGKYWQTVRASASMQLEFSLPNTDIIERLETLSNTNTDKGVYGGRGWANYAISYFNDCYRFMLEIKQLLKPGGTALVVIGNSILQGILIPTDQYLGKIAECVGLKLVSIDVPRAARVGNSIIRSDVRVAKAKHRLYEAVVEIRKHQSKNALTFSTISSRSGGSPVNLSTHGLPGCRTSHSDLAWLYRPLPGS